MAQGHLVPYQPGWCVSFILKQLSISSHSPLPRPYSLHFHRARSHRLNSPPPATFLFDPPSLPLRIGLSAVYYEQGEYDQAIKTCERAADEGRELRADYKMIAK